MDQKASFRNRYQLITLPMQSYIVFHIFHLTFIHHDGFCLFFWSNCKSYKQYFINLRLLQRKNFFLFYPFVES